MARILVIDDETTIAHVIRLLLESRGHEVIVADEARGASRWLSAGLRTRSSWT